MNTRLNQSEARNQLIDNVCITSQKVTIAKAYILKNFDTDTKKVIHSLVSAMNASIPREITLITGQPEETRSGLKKAGEGLSWILVGCEAIWSLISNGLIIPQDGRSSMIPAVQYKLLRGGGSSEASTWDLSSLDIQVPTKILLPSSVSKGEYQPLSDPDLYLNSLNIPNLHRQVEESLREAVKCFTHELYLACLAMLGRASEGAWIECGLSLISTICPDLPKYPAKVLSSLESPFIGTGKKIKEVLTLYEREAFAAVRTRSCVRPQDLRNALVWADCVRESRNSVHYGAEPSMPNIKLSQSLFCLFDGHLNAHNKLKC